MRQRSIKKQLWLNDKEDKILKAKAAKAGLSESEFIRSIIKGYHIKEQPNETIQKFSRQLYGIQIFMAIYLHNISNILRKASQILY